MVLPAPVTALASQAGSHARHAGAVVGLYAALALIALVGVGFLFAALYIWLASESDPLVAALLIGGTLTAIAAIWVGVLIYRGKQRKRRQRRATANTALVASSLSIADAGLRIVSRSKGRMFWPAVATLAAAWYMTRDRND